MTDPLDTNDEWADLAREFKLDKPPAPSPAERAIEEETVEPHRATDERVEDAALADGDTEAEAEDEFEDAEDGTTGEATADGDQPGTGRKRRRRRRRRRKGGAPADGAATPADETESETETAPEAEADEEPVTQTVAETVAESDEFAEDADGEPVPLAADEDTASDVLRELIATWNVPSWGEIVDGLYRPER